MGDLIRIITEIGIPYAYDHFSEGESPAPPFLVFLIADSDHFSADGVVYYKKSHVHIELYTDKKDIINEAKVETALNNNGIYYEKNEVWIPSERLFEVVYSFTILGV